MTTPGMPGIAPVSRSSSDGLVAAVIATVSPSQPSPLVIHTTWTTRRSLRACPGVNSACASALAGRPWTARGRRRGRGARRGRRAPPGTRGGARRCRAGAIRRARPVTSPASARRASAWDTDGRSAPTSWPSRRWVSGSEMRMPPGSTFPQRAPRCQSSSARRTSSRGWQAIARWTSRSLARLPARRRRASRICGHGRMRSAKPASSIATRPGRSTCHFAERCEQLVGARVPRLQQVARAHELGRGAVADLDVDRDRAVEQQQPWGRRSRRGPLRGIAVADLDLEHDDGRHLADDHAHADVELLGEVGVGVEQVAVGGSWPLPRALDGLLDVVGEHEAAPSSHRCQVPSATAPTGCRRCR